MKTKYSFKLIEGVFVPSEGDRVLSNLISSKISYHTLENFSARERFGKDIPHSEKRIRTLKKTQTSLKEFFASAAKKGMKLKIDGIVEITIIE